MSTEHSTGVSFPGGPDGSRSTSATGRAVVAGALRRTDPVGAAGCERETNWRTGYLVHFRRLVEAGLASRQAALQIAGDGLTALHEQMAVVGPDGAERPLSQAFVAAAPAAADAGYDTATVTGTAEPDRTFSLPFRGERLTGDALRRRLDEWVRTGALEASCATAVQAVADDPEGLDLAGLQVAVLGAGAEMGPLQSLLRWGADVVAVDLPRPELWKRLLSTARQGAGRMHLPVPRGTGEVGDDALAAVAGADLLHQLGPLAAWLEQVPDRLVLGNYVYADGATNVRVSAAVDALTRHLLARRDDLALAFLATPTDVFAVPGEAVAHSGAAYGDRTRISKLLGRPLRTVSGGRLLRRHYVDGVEPGIDDSLVPQQGPNYALAKRLQRWRATTARDAGTTVSFHVAPPTRTHSVLKNRALAAAYAGAHRFGVQVFEPATSNTLMAALLVSDLRNGTPVAAHPWQEEAYAAAHGGLWTTAYQPRSALGLAAVLGLGGARR